MQTRKLLLASIILVTLKSTMSCGFSWGEEIHPPQLPPPPQALNLQPTKSEFSCLSRDQKEKIDECFMENLMCHTKVATLTDPPTPLESWEVIVGTALGGLVAGLVLEQQVRH